jgi:hypothetical protein
LKPRPVAADTRRNLSLSEEDTEMKKLMLGLSLVALAFTGSAVASGGADSGGSGGNSGGVSAGGAKAGGGSTAACDPVINWASSAGYIPYGAGAAAVWVNYTVKGCGGGSSYVISVSMDDVAGVAPSYSRSFGLQATGKSSAYVIDNEPVANDTTYQLTWTVSDLSGNVVDSRSSLETTPKARVA